MKLRHAIPAALLGTALLGGGLTILPASASAASCVTSHSYAHTVTSRGSQSWTWTTKRACGRNYQKWEHRSSQSYTGAVSDMHLYRNEYSYPHYTQHETIQSISAKGTVTYRVVNTSG